MTRALSILSVLSAAVFLCSCQKTPDYVIKPQEMAELLADVHTGEAVVEANYTSFSNDSSKKALRQAIFDKHGVTHEQFDTSLVWYGHNIDKYLEVYDNTIKILQERYNATGSQIAMEETAMFGDSADVWQLSRHAIINSRYPSNMLSVDLIGDENFEPGDIYTFRARAIDNQERNINWLITANYDDGYIDVLSTSNTIPANNWCEITFVTDSTKRLERIRGTLEFKADPTPITDIWLDSISLVRKRLVPETYYKRSQVRQFKELK